jgi:hypothetical protein
MSKIAEVGEEIVAKKTKEDKDLFGRDRVIMNTILLL